MAGSCWAVCIRRNDTTKRRTNNYGAVTHSQGGGAAISLVWESETHRDCDLSDTELPTSQSPASARSRDPSIPVTYSAHVLRRTSLTGSEPLDTLNARQRRRRGKDLLGARPISRHPIAFASFRSQQRHQGQSCSLLLNPTRLDFGHMFTVNYVESFRLCSNYDDRTDAAERARFCSEVIAFTVNWHAFRVTVKSFSGHISLLSGADLRFCSSQLDISFYSKTTDTALVPRVVCLAWYSFYRPRRDGRLNRLS